MRNATRPRAARRNPMHRNAAPSPKRNRALIPNCLALYLRQLYLSQTVLAKELGINKNTVTRWCVGYADVPDAQKLRICAFLRVGVTDLFQYSDLSAPTPDRAAPITEALLRYYPVLKKFAADDDERP